jgi:hypothetical protein
MAALDWIDPVNVPEPEPGFSSGAGSCTGSTRVITAMRAR